MRKLPKDLALRNALATMLGVVVVAAVVLGPTTQSSALTVSLDCPQPQIVHSGEMFSGDISLNLGASTLGAYTFAVTYDAAVVTVAAITGGNVPEFASPPISNPAEYGSGRTRLLAFNSMSLSSPTGPVTVARVTFNALGPAGSSTMLGLEVITLADTDGARLAADTTGCAVDIVASTPIVPGPSESPTPPSTTATASATAAIATPTESASPTPSKIPPACIGDCDGDGMVTVDEVLRGVNVALGAQTLDACLDLDRNADGAITVDELVASVLATLEGCPSSPTPTEIQSPSTSPQPTDATTPTVEIVEATASATASSAALNSPTATPSASPSSTPNAAVNLPPLLPTFSLYRAYPGFPISIAINATDPDGDAVQYSGDGLPPGASLDPETGVFSWTPLSDQAGPLFVPIACTDQGVPPAAVRSAIPLEVVPADDCTVPACSADSGCSLALKPIAQGCCSTPPSEHIGHALVSCPDGALLVAGRNNEGFGPLQNCDRLRVINFLQAGASVRFHVRARCVPTGRVLTLHGRLETTQRLLFNLDQFIVLRDAGDGYGERLSVVFPVAGNGPFFDLTGAEAQLQLTLLDGVTTLLTHSVRVVLTFDPLADLPDPQDLSPP